MSKDGQLQLGLGSSFLSVSRNPYSTLHIIPYFMGRCVIWIDITDMNVNLQMRMVKILTRWILDLSSYETVTADSILDLSSYEL